MKKLSIIFLIGTILLLSFPAQPTSDLNSIDESQKSPVIDHQKSWESINPP